MKKKGTGLLSAVLVLALTIPALRYAWLKSVPAEATTVTQVQQNINELNIQINKINQGIASMEEKKEILAEEMADLDAEILNTLTSIGMKEDEIEEKADEIVAKQADIEVTEDAYEEAKQKETDQYQDMIMRMRKMYEHGELDSVGLLLGGGGLGDMLNRMDFTESVYEYDRAMLTQYVETKEQVLNLWNRLEEEKCNLETDKAALETEKERLQDQKAELDNLLEKKKKQSSNYDAEIKKARQEANVAKVKLQQEQQQLKKLQAAATTSNAAGGTYTSDYNSIINQADGSELGKQIARYACQYVGNPYVSGGTSLTNGADCSGFTYRVFGDFGYKLPRTSTDQKNVGTGISYSEAQPGDIICYPGHVAIYIGGGKIVHASTPQSGIKVSSATYREMLAVRRVI